MKQIKPFDPAILKSNTFCQFEITLTIFILNSELVLSNLR